MQLKWIRMVKSRKKSSKYNHSAHSVNNSISKNTKARLMQNKQIFNDKYIINIDYEFWQLH